LQKEEEKNVFREEKIVTNLTHFDAFINALITYTNISLTFFPPAMMTTTMLRTTTFSSSSAESFANTRSRLKALPRRRNAHNRNLITTTAVVSEDKTDDTNVLLPDEVKDLKLRDIISLWITQILQTYGDKPSSDNAPIVEGEIDDLVGGPIFLALYPYFR